MKSRVLNEGHQIPFSETEIKARIFSCLPEVLELVRALATEISKLPPDPQYAPNKPRCLICGGFVRDAILGMVPNDIDLQVFGVSQAVLQEIVAKLFETKITVFRAIKVDLGPTFIIPNYEIDIGIVLRLQEKGERFFEDSDPSITPKESVHLGDFTCNSMLVDPLTGEFFDLLNGLQDLRDGVLRLCNKKHFKFYPFLVFRGIQLLSRYNLVPDAECMEIFKELSQSGELDDLEGSARIREELSKLLLKSPQPSKGFEILSSIGALKVHFPELEQLVVTKKDKFNDTLFRLDAVAKELSVISIEARRSERLVSLLAALTFYLTEEETKAMLQRVQYRREYCLRVLLCRYHFAEIFEAYQELEKIPLSSSPEKKVRAKNESITEAPLARTKQATIGRIPRLGRIALATPNKQIPSPEQTERQRFKQYHLRVQKLLRLSYPASWKELYFFASTILKITDNSHNRAKALNEFRTHVEKFELNKSTKDLLTTEELISDLGIAPGFHIGIIQGEVNRRRFELLFQDRAKEWVKENLDELMTLAKEQKEKSLENL